MKKSSVVDLKSQVLNQAVKRNVERFPADFMFRLTNEECRRSQIVTFGFAFGECSLRSKASSAHFRLTTYTTRDAKEIAKILSLLP